MRRVIIVVSALLLAGCGPSSGATSSPYALPTPDHRAHVDTIKPKAVALNEPAKSLADAYTRRDMATIRAQLPNVHDAANALNDIVLATEPTLPELRSAQEDCIRAATDSRELAGEWDDDIRHRDYGYVAKWSWLNSPLRDSGTAVKRLK